MELPATCYARAADGVHIAYHAFGDGPIDVVGIPGFVSHLEMGWEEGAIDVSRRRLASIARVIEFDKRGTGLSDRSVGVPSLEARMDDVRAVMDAVGSQRAVLNGWSEGGPMAILFAVTYPERTAGLILQGSFARITRAPDYPWGVPSEALTALKEHCETTWGTGSVILGFFPSLAGDPAVRDFFARVERNSATPGSIVDIFETLAETDVRAILGAVQVPTLVLHSRGDPMVPVGLGRYLADHIPNARYVELDTDDHMVDTSAVIEEFLTGAHHEPEPDRVLASVLFTDVVSSTERATSMGDARWNKLLEDHDERVRRQIAHFRGETIKSLGDGFLATFDGPARAVKCAHAVRDALEPLGLRVRAGVHTGEIELRDGDVSGVAVHIGARVCALAESGEVLATRTVKDLTAGSGLHFEDRGEHHLKGIADPWQLYAVTP